MARKPGGTKPQPPRRQDQPKPPPALLVDLPSPEVLETLPENARIAVVEAAALSGPPPPPIMYGEYDNVLSGSAERILRMAEKEQDHRIEWENDALNQNIR